METNLVFVRGDPMPIPPAVRAHFLPPAKAAAVWGWSPALRERLTKLALMKPRPIFHIHGIWSAPQLLAACVAASHSIPVVLSRMDAGTVALKWRGMGTQAKEKIYWTFMAYPAFKRAHALHAITALERSHLSALFPGQSIVVIPNAIQDDVGNVGRSVSRERMILFLGRLEPKKGVHLLLSAFAEARVDKEWRLCIVGPAWSRLST